MKNNKIIVSIIIVLLVYAGLATASNYLKEMNESLIGGFDELSYLIVGGLLTAYNSQTHKKEETNNNEIGKKIVVKEKDEQK